MSKPRSLSALVSDGSPLDDGALNLQTGTTNGLVYLDATKALVTNASLLFDATTGQLSSTSFSGSASGLTGFKTVNGNNILGSGNIQIDGGVTSFNTRTGAITLSSSDVTTALTYTPQTTLVSGTNIKTINSQSILGSGNLQLGAAGGGNDQVFYLNDQTVTTNYTIPVGKNAMTTGPVTVSNGVTVTVSDGSRWAIL